MGRFFSISIFRLSTWMIILLCEIRSGFPQPSDSPSSVDSGTDLGLVQGLGLEDLPEISKINISQTEYALMMQSYLKRLRVLDLEHVPNLITFDAEFSIDYEKKRPVTKIKFPKLIANTDWDLDQSEVRLLFPPSSKEKAVRVMVWHRVSEGPGARRRRLLSDSKTVYLSDKGSKWSEFEVTPAIRQWLNDGTSLVLEVECPGCIDMVPMQARLNVLVYSKKVKARTRRGTTSPGKSYAEDVNECNADEKKRCCRHSMKVTFKSLKVPQIRSIVQPKSYEAGFCKGRCPLNYNIATNHSRIQSLVHRLDRKAVPRVCCTPSKLAPLDILRVDPYDFTKLTVERWENMKVLECACS